MHTKRKEMLNLWSLKDYKLKVKEKNNKVKEEFFKKTFTLKIKNNQQKKSQLEKMQKNLYQDLKINYLTNYNKQDI